MSVLPFDAKRMIRDIEELVGWLLPGAKTDIRIRLNRKRRPADTVEMYGLYQLRDGKTMTDVEFENLGGDEWTRVGIGNVAADLKDRRVWTEKGGNGWVLGYWGGELPDDDDTEWEECDTPELFLFERFGCVSEIDATDITRIRPDLGVNPFEQLVEKDRRPVTFGTFWDCYELLTNHEAELRKCLGGVDTRRETSAGPAGRRAPTSQHYRKYTSIEKLAADLRASPGAVRKGMRIEGHKWNKVRVYGGAYWIPHKTWNALHEAARAKPPKPAKPSRLKPN